MPSFVLILVALLAGTQTSWTESEGPPRRGGIMRLWYPTDWRTLDPAIAFDSDSVILSKLLFRGLLDFDQNAQVVVDQAESWSVSPDGKTYTFRLLPGVRFSHGREVEAEDYVFTIQRVLDPRTSSPGQTYYLDILGAKEFASGRAQNVRGLRALDRHTLSIELDKPSFTFRYLMAMAFAAALPREWVQHHGDRFPYHLAGSGPYRVAKWRRAVEWQFERNPHYHKDEGFIDRFDLMLGGDTALAAMMVERGDRDWANVGAVSATAFLRQPSRRRMIERVNVVSTQYFFLNTEQKPFDDVRVRQAFNHAVDRQRLIQLASSFGTEAHGIVPKSMPWSNPSLPRYSLDRAAAQRLLREAGFPNGFKTQIYYIQTRTPDSRAALSIQEDLRKIGVQAELVPISQPAFEVKARTRGAVPSGIWGWAQDYPDASNFLDVLLSGRRITDTDCNNLAFYRNTAVDHLLARAEQSMDSGERLTLHREAERLIMTDAPWVPLMEEQLAIARNSRVRGTPWHPVWLWRFEKLWLE